MTGSIHLYNRQHSSTTATTTTTMNSTAEQTYQPKLRRCSSADDHGLMESLPDYNQQPVFKRGYATSDADSGTEEIEQQIEHLAVAECYDNDDRSSNKSFGQNLDEGFSEYDREEATPIQTTTEEPTLSTIQEDLKLAKMIPDEAKKDFCYDTSYAFHGEFARLIGAPLSLNYACRYYLFAQDDLDHEFVNSIPFAFVKVDNAKAQFKCPNPRCQHAWTSMRARISFFITAPEIGYVVLKILGQNCQHCSTNADALWYIDEVCRVMRNLAQSIFNEYFPDMLNSEYLEVVKPVEYNPRPSSRHPNHDPTQRKGKMYAPHAKELCEACQLGLCFAC